MDTDLFEYASGSYSRCGGQASVNITASLRITVSKNPSKPLVNQIMTQVGAPRARSFRNELMSRTVDFLARVEEMCINRVG